MKSGRSHVIWIPDGGTGKIRSCFIKPSILRVFFIFVLMCVCSVPFMETGLFSLTGKVHELEEKRQKLQEEISNLEYLKEALAGLESKEKILRNYYGMSEYQSLKQITGGGGNAGPGMHKPGLNQGSNRQLHDYQSITAHKALKKKLHTLDSNYEILNKLMVKQDEAWKGIPSIIPVDLINPRVTSGFGWRKNPFTSRNEFHAGIDIAGEKGTRIIAPGRGVVITLGYDRWLGNYLVLQHTGNIKTIYGHLDKLCVTKGTVVNRGELLGHMGNTGLSTSNHLHYSVILNNRAVNPMQFILDMKG